MPRPRRLHVPGGIYHVILRGNHRQPIFFGDSDMLRLEAYVAEAAALTGTRVHAYCWMPNHIHLAMQPFDSPLGAAMIRIASRHARYVQRRVPTTGHLFERRYRAILVDDVRYALELLRYIHLNPVRAGMVDDPAEYPWSGHRAYLGDDANGRPWLTTDHLLRMFASEPEVARHAYRKHVLAGIGVDPPAELRGGKATTQLGRCDEERRRPTIRRSPPQCDTPLTLDQLIERVCAEHGLRTEDLSGPGRSRVAARARVAVAQHAIRLNLCTLSELARRFGRSTSTLSESLARCRALGCSVASLHPDSTLAPQ